MGRDHNETGGRKPKKVVPKHVAPDFWTFHPKEADKAAMAAFEAEIGDVMEALEEETRRGVTFTLTRTKQGDALCLIARNRFEGYGEGQALSVFNASPWRVALGMLYVLRVLHPDWPGKPATTTQRELDW